MRRLRVTADDFGFTPGVTDGILEAHRNGIVTHTSAMAGGLDFRRGMALLRDYPGLGVGVHLMLTWGAPVTPPGDVGSLLGSGGRFAPLRVIVGRGMTGRLRTDQLAREWRAQIAKVVDAGIVPTHLDSHHHVHLLPNCLGVAAALAKEFGIHWLRRPDDRSAPSGAALGRTVRQVALSVLCRRRWPVATSDAFRGVAIQGAERFDAAVAETIRSLSQGTTELVVHPGKPDAALAEEDTFVWQRANELRALCSPELAQVLRDSNVLLDRPSC